MNLVVTHTGNSIHVDFGDYFPGYIEFSRASYNTRYMEKVHQMIDHIVVWGSDGKTWMVVPPGGDVTKGFVVDSINATTPTDLDHLHDLIQDMIQ